MTSAAHSSRAARISSLDGLRGIAALVVVIGHSIGAVRSPPGIAGPSVILFFVLSGYCLAASALRGDRLSDRAQFYVRRIFRIHPPFVAALLIAWLASHVAWSGPCCAGLSPWILNFTHLSRSASELVPHLFFPGTAQNLMPVGWTLEVEMIFSILLPLFVLIAREGHWSLALGLALWALFQREPAYSEQVYAIHFVVGILLYEASGRIAAAMNRAPRLAPLVLALTAIYGTLAGMKFVPVQWNVFVWPGVSTLLSTSLFALAISSAAFTIAAVHLSSIRGLLEWRPIAFLGRVSYSLYLLHFTVLLLGVRMVEEPLTDLELVGFILGVVVASTIAAVAMVRFVELPSIQAGNWACSWIARRTQSEERLSRIQTRDAASDRSDG
jgi:peptidoglycan/LPS O-acetylase OafA/YrhL